MIDLINSIVKKDYVKADSIISEAVELIMAKKLHEAKMKTAAKMCEQGLDKSAAELTRRDVVEEEELEEQEVDNKVNEGTLGMNVPYIQARTGPTAGGGHMTSVYSKDTKNVFNGGTVRGYDRAVTKTNNGTQIFQDKRHMKDLGNNNVKMGGQSSLTTKVVNEEEQLDEARVKIVKARIRGGVIQRRKKVSNVPGMTMRGGKLKRMTPAERRNRKMGQRSGKIKRRSKMNRAIMKRQRSIRKRKALGI